MLRKACNVNTRWFVTELLPFGKDIRRQDTAPGKSAGKSSYKTSIWEEDRTDMFKIRREPAEYESKSLRLPIEMIEKVQKLADSNNISFNKVITQCVDYALDNLDDNKDENKKM